MKKILIGLALVVVLVGAVIGFLVSHADEIVRRTIEKVGGRATGTEVVLKSVALDMIGGKARLSGLTVGNPTGFGTPNAFGLDEIAVTLDIASVTADAIRIPLIVIDAPKVTYEWAASGSNIDLIQKNVDAFAKAMDGGGASESSEEDGVRKLVIDRLVIKDAAVGVSADFLDGREMGGVLPTIVLTDIGTDSGGATPGEVATKVISSITGATTRLIADLGIGDLAKTTMDAAKSVVEGAAGVGDAAKGAVEGVGDAAKGVTDGLKNIFGN